MSYIDREHDEIDRRLDAMSAADEREYMVRFCEEVAECEFQEWMRERIAEEVREDRMEGEAA